MNASSAPASDADGASSVVPERRRRIAVLAVLAAMAAVVLDAGTVNVALPTLSRALGVTPSHVVLVITAYQVGLVMALLPCGALGARFGHARVFATGLALFVAGAVACASAPSLHWLIAFRLAQGAGTAAVMALGMALLRITVPRGRLGAAIGWNALTVALTSAAAPSLGATLLSFTPWRAVFVASVPLAALALIAAPALPGNRRTLERLDVVSIVMTAASVALLVIAVQLAATAAWLAIASSIAGALVATALYRRERSRSEPLVPLDLLRVRSFRWSVIASLCCFAGQTAGIVALPFLLKQDFHLDLLTIGLYLTAWPASVAAAALVVGRLADRMASAWLCVVGAACLAAGLAAAAVLPSTAAPGLLVPCFVLCGVGFGLFQTPNNRTLFLSAPDHRSGAAGGMQGTARVSGQTAGAMAAAMLFALVPMTAAPRVVLGAASVLVVLAGFASAYRARD